MSQAAQTTLPERERVAEWAEENTVAAARALARDEAEFFLTLCTIQDYQTGKHLRFEERPIQKAFREAILKHRLVVGLKAREVGWTWELALLLLWEAWAYAPYQAIYLCQREDNAKDFMRRIRFAHSQLPRWLGYPQEDKPTTQTRFGVTYKDGSISEIQVFPSSPSALQFWHPRRVIVDEWGLLEEEALPSALGAVGLKGYFVGLGTAEGTQNEHAMVYISCRDGFSELFAPQGESFHHIFAAWRDNPANLWLECPECRWRACREDVPGDRCIRCGHDGLRQEWRRPSGGTKRDTERMYPADDQEAFALTAPGEAVYPEFNAAVHVAAQPLKAEIGKPLLRGWDFGYNRPACVVMQNNSLGQTLILREYQGREVGVADFAREVLEDCNLRWRGWEWVDWGDPSGRAKRETDAKSCFEILKKEFRLRLNPGKADHRRRREAVAGRLTRLVNGRPALLVDPSCRLLIDGFKGMYHYPRQRDTSDASEMQQRIQEMARERADQQAWDRRRAEQQEAMTHG